MTKRSHNKKRNVGIIYEQLVLKLSKALVENDKKTFEATKKIIKEHFKKTSELYREYRLINSLATVNIRETSVVPAILDETRKAVWKINNRRLNTEKSRLIRAINENFGKSFYSTKVSNYRNLATIDILLSEYKKGKDADHSTILEFSDKVTGILLSEKKSSNIEEMKDPQVNNLVVKLMNEKFNKSYSKNLQSDQLKIIQEWTTNGDTPSLRSMIKASKIMALNHIKEYKANCENSFLGSNIDRVKLQIESIEVGENIADSDIVKAMTLQEIIKELSGDEK